MKLTPTSHQRPTCEVDRHDFDHVEVQLGFHEPLDYDVDIYLFAPPTLGLSNKNPKVEFLNSMRSFVRLQTSLGLGASAERVSPERVFLEATSLDSVLQDQSTNGVGLRRAVKSAAGAYEAYLKSRSKAHIRWDLRNDNNYNEEAHAQVLLGEIHQTEALVNKLRNVIACGQCRVPIGNQEPLDLGPLDMLNEYLSYMMVDYLSCFRRHVSHFFDTEKARDVKIELNRLGISELKVRREAGINVDLMAGPDERGEYLYKLSLLKKYFQRSLFINVKTSPVAKRIFQPMAATAAGAAAVWATLFQQAQGHDSFLVKMGLNPFTIVILGVLAYVIKDRIKDMGRHFLVGKVERVLPDIERVLVYESEGAKPCELGRIRETIRLVSLPKLPPLIHDLRYAGVNSGLEAEIGEDIIHYNKKILLNQNSKWRLKRRLAIKNIPDLEWGMREIIRINLRDYLQNLDDPFKEISVIDDEGNVSKAETHKVYFAHLALQFTYTTKEGVLTSETKLAKLMLDKKGLVKVSNDSDLENSPTQLLEGMVEFNDHAAQRPYSNMEKV